MEKQNATVHVDPASLSGSANKAGDDNKAKLNTFSVELEALLKKYNFIIYAANTVLENGEVVPMLKVIPSNEAKKEDGKSEEVITVA